MNLLHLKYAIEVAKAKSINKAAEVLYMNQANLSRSIKELEDNLGIQVFKRTPKGIQVTAKGEEFLEYAHSILQQVDEIEKVFKEGKQSKQKFSVSVPRASYIAHAFIEFVRQLDKDRAIEIFYKESNAFGAIDNVLSSNYNLGIIRYQDIFDDKFKELLNEKGLEWELLCEFNYLVAISKEHPLAARPYIEYKDLSNLIEIAHADPYVPSVPFSKIKEKEYLDAIEKRIFIFERSNQFDLLNSVPDTFMWVSPIPKPTLEKNGIVQLVCRSDKRIYRDVLIYRKGYRFSELDKLFITEACQAKREFIA